jgi:dihydropteroate synthase
MYTLNCRGRLLTIENPIVMGILNVTPDSFFEESRIQSQNDLLARAGKMIEEGATILDIGGQSSRPGAEMIGKEEELKRVIPAIQLVRQHFTECFISVDTFYAEVAEQAIEAGADIVNDISAGNNDAEMINTVAKMKVPFIAMHMRGTAVTMSSQTIYKDLVADLLDYFREKIQSCEKAGISDLILDPGFGFAKNIDQNFELLKKLDAFHILDRPLLVGISRKSMIYKTLGIGPENALNGTTVLHTVALQKGASILRVHDVNEAVECIRLSNMLH